MNDLPEAYHLINIPAGELHLYCEVYMLSIQRRCNLVGLHAELDPEDLALVRGLMEQRQLLQRADGDWRRVLSMLEDDAGSHWRPV